MFVSPGGERVLLHDQGLAVRAGALAQRLVTLSPGGAGHMKTALDCASETSMIQILRNHVIRSPDNMHSFIR